MLLLTGNRRRGVVLAIAAVLVVAGCSNATTPKSQRQKDVTSTQTNVPLKNCGSQCTGEINGAAYAIRLPEQWNGTLLLYSHGYRFANPIPAEPNASVQTFAQVTSTDDGNGDDPLSKQLLADGYALAGSAYKSNGWAVADGVQADEQLHDQFVKLVGKPKRTYVWGDSLGGLITEIVAEKHPDWVDGAAPMCGAVAGPNLNFDLALDVAFAVKALIDPQLRLVDYSSADDAAANWTTTQAKIEKAAADVSGGGTAKVLFIAGLVDAPAKTATYDGTDITSQVKAAVEALLTALAFGTSGRYEVEQRVGGNPSDNTKANYDARLSDAEKSLITAVGGNPAQLLAKLDAEPRVAADSSARQKFEQLGNTTGKIVVPTVTMHTEYDPLVLVQNETVLADRAQQNSASGNLVQFYIAPPSAYSEELKAPYGAGHCNFNDEQREGLLKTLDSWVRGGVIPTPSGVAGTFGVGFDPAYAPGAWPGETGS